MDKIICVGKNYLAHALELGDPVPEKPVIFLKPPSVLKKATKWGETLELRLPADQGETHFETEIVLRISKGGYRLKGVKLEDYVDGISVGLDMTLRTLQSSLKKNGHPWTVAKVFPDAATVGPFVPLSTFRNLKEVPFSFELEGAPRQAALSGEMMFNFEALLELLSHHFPLAEGDLIFTGTPKGVGEVLAGQTGILKFGIDFEYSVHWDLMAL